MRALGPLTARRAFSANPYLAFAARRLAQAVAVLTLAYVFTFVVISVLPGDPVTNVLRNPQNGFTEEDIQRIVAAQGLDKPVLAINTCIYWWALRQNGIDDKIEGFGSLLIEH